MTDSQYQEIIKRLDRIERHLNVKPKSTWVKVTIIQELTGWDKKFMEKARLNGLVKQRKGTNGIEYLLESINPLFIKKICEFTAGLFLKQNETCAAVEP